MAEAASPLRGPSHRFISIIRLKAFVRSNLPSDSVVRKVIEADDDSLPVIEFVSRLALWLRLLDARVE